MIDPDDVPFVSRYQAGVFTRAQALADGWTKDRVARRVGSGRWRVLAGAGLVNGAMPTTAQALAWAIHLTWPFAVVSHVTAGALHGFPLPPALVFATAHATLPSSRTHLHSLRGIVAHHVPLPAHHVLAPDVGPRLTTRGRTAVDCLRCLDLGQALDLYAWLATRGVLTRDQLAEEVRSTPGRRGTPQLLRVLQLTRTGALSGAELRLHTLLRKAGITGWEANARVVVDGGRTTFTVDVLFRAARVIVEVDGWEAHSGRRAFEHDRRRQNLLHLERYVVLRVTWADLTERPDVVLRQIALAVARAS